MTLRQQMRLFQQQAAEKGIPDTHLFFDMTPGEIALHISAFAAAKQQQLSELHMLSQLVALAVHAPRQLPSGPPAAPLRAMSPEEMKLHLLAFGRKEETQ